MTNLEDEFKGCEVTVFIPATAPAEVNNIVMDAVCSLVSHLEDIEPVIRDRTDWDMFISCSDAEHQIQAAFDRVVAERDVLRNQLTHERLLLENPSNSPKVIPVTRTQVNAAKLARKRLEESGQDVPPAIEAIANARETTVLAATTEFKADAQQSRIVFDPRAYEADVYHDDVQEGKF